LFFLTLWENSLKKSLMLWQPLVTKTNRDTSNKSQRQILLWRLQEDSTRSLCVMECFGPNILFFFYLFFFWFYFSFSFSFSFSFRTMKKACDKKFTWQVTWCDIISLELDGRVWKMTSGHLEYTWWPWVGHEAGMRMKHGHKGRVIY